MRALPAFYTESAMFRGITRLSGVWGVLSEARLGASTVPGLEGTWAAQRWSHPANAAWQQSARYSTDEFKVGGGPPGRADGGVSPAAAAACASHPGPASSLVSSIHALFYCLERTHGYFNGTTTLF